MITRRFLLKSATLAACSAAAHPWLSTMTFASVPGDNRLVVIVLRGAMDGMDAVQPYGDKGLRALRTGLSVGPQGGAHDLDGFFALHQDLGDLLPLWQAGELAFAHAIATPYRDKRSHFDGQDLLEAGTGNDLPIDQQKGGWLNRLLQDMPNARAETAYSVGTEEMLILSGKAHALSWAPDARLSLSPQARLLLTDVYHDDALFREAAADAEAIGGSLPEDRMMGAKGPSADAVKLATFAASRLNGDTRIAAFSLAGWDSHARQQQVIGRSLGQLSAAILTLREALGANWARTTVLAMTEFGRTARENGSAGTDHGTGGAMLMAGGAVRGGTVYGDWPGLAEGQLYQDRDLMPTRDVRAYAGWAMRGLFGTEAGHIEGTIFPGLDLGPDPGILR
ncbi:DUF1501 domain-containing protein [Paracoccus sphaerophysae]|uniref:Twin-arginine translocation pathway signal n=1 Tax=Paracoccus sphaerophysae TaxID=690417 RepID=A0A099EUD8_9RHOB|nr:DUF1501 domain-containing protein [Paracoccus sphaerophysae]KGJ01995.1 twin-arginine translocation pathway signal [Paracoccus sphaerophysae]